MLPELSPVGAAAAVIAVIGVGKGPSGNAGAFKPEVLSVVDLIIYDGARAFLAAPF
jgi:hypothetical protein